MGIGGFVLANSQVGGVHFKWCRTEFALFETISEGLPDRRGFVLPLLLIAVASFYRFQFRSLGSVLRDLDFIAVASFCHFSPRRRGFVPPNFDKGSTIQFSPRVLLRNHNDLGATPPARSDSLLITGSLAQANRLSRKGQNLWCLPAGLTVPSLETAYE